jgi:hypothetical protein
MPCCQELLGHMVGQGGYGFMTRRYLDNYGVVGHVIGAPSL